MEVDLHGFAAVAQVERHSHLVTVISPRSLQHGREPDREPGVVQPVTQGVVRAGLVPVGVAGLGASGERSVAGTARMESTRASDGDRPRPRPVRCKDDGRDTMGGPIDGLRYGTCGVPRFGSPDLANVPGNLSEDR